jgi:DNA-binding beta-propeller fold protein YncE
MRKPFPGTIFSALILLSIIILGYGCSKTPTGGTAATPPSVVTVNIMSNVTNTTALSGGIVTNGNNGVTTTNGVCWSSTNQLPTISDSKTSDTVNVNGFTSNITGLTPSTTYYLRAYASNEGGVGYGAVVKFTTNATAATINTTVTTLAGSANFGDVDGTGVAALFNGPQKISFNPVAGNLYVSDTFNNLIRTVTTSGTVSTLTQPTLGLVNGPLSSALFYNPSTIAFDAQGNAYVAELGNNVIRKITTAGIVSTLTGNTLSGYADGSAGISEFVGPAGICTDAAGNIYVADRGNNLIRKVTPAGVVSSLSGAVSPVGISQTASPNYVDGTSGPASAFNGPCAIAIDPAGLNLYVADYNNHAIRMVTIATGAVTTLAGNPVQKTIIGSPVALATDAAGDLFIADAGGRILEITPGRSLYVLAGANNADFINGSGAVARFSTPQGVTVDTQGNVYVADFNNNCIRKIAVKIQ